MRKRKAFTLVELLVVIAIIGLLAALLFPALASARRTSKSAGCLSNLHQQHLALNGYLDHYDDFFPFITFQWTAPDTTMNLDLYEKDQRSIKSSYANLMQPYAQSRGIFSCPADFGAVFYQDGTQGVRDKTMFERYGTSYRPAAELGTNYQLSLSDIKDPTDIFWACDATGYWHSKYHRSLERGIGNGDFFDADHWQMNTVFIDGHSKISRFGDEVWNRYRNFLWTLPNPDPSP